MSLLSFHLLYELHVVRLCLIPGKSTSQQKTHRYSHQEDAFWVSDLSGKKKTRMAAPSVTMLHKAFLHCNSIYRPLVSRVMDELFFYVRSRSPSRCGIKWFHINVSFSCLPSGRGYCLHHWSRCMMQTTSGIGLWQRTAEWKERKKEETKENKNIWWCGVKSKEECVGGKKREKQRRWKDKKKREEGREEEMSGNTKQRQRNDRVRDSQRKKYSLSHKPISPALSGCPVVHAPHTFPG